MLSGDYNDLLLQNSEVTDTTCPSCQLDATFKFIKIKEVEPEVMLVVFECKHCHIKDTSIFNENSGQHKLKIECYFTDKADLRREVNLNMNAKLFLKYGDVECEHESSLPVVTTVEGLIDQAIDAFSGNNAIFGDKEKMLQSAEKLKGLKSNPVFYMRIEDNEGTSRMGRINRGIYEMQGCDLEDFNDEKVSHTYID